MSNHPKQILYTAVYKWFQYSKSCDGMWDTKWITGGFQHCLGDSVISLFHLSFGLNGWMWCTCHCCPSSWLRQIYFCGSCAVCAAYSWWKAAFVSFCTWFPQDLNQASLSLTGGGCSHSHICTLLAFHTAHSHGGIRPQWQILCAVQGWPRQNMFSQQLFRSEMLRN